jgi:hypothetical protein
VATKRFLMAGLTLILTMSAFAQQGSTGSIAGTVVDPSGQVVPKATVKVTSELNGESRTAETNETGDFFFGAITPGAYTVRVEATGFRPSERTGNMVLSSGRLALGKLALEVGSVSESVQVTAQAAIVATTTSSQSTTIDSKQMDLIVVKGRDPMSIFKTLPGVQIIADTDTWGGSFSSTIPTFQGRGGNTMYVDGINGGDSNAGGAFSAITSMDAIAEVNVQANAYTAEYGLRGGAQANLVTKHGGSDLHGTAYWYKRHEMFNANTFTNNRDGLAKPKYRYQDIGGTIGGPVPFKIPILNRDGKRFNFFYSVEDMRLVDVTTPQYFTMPTALERTGDFSQTRTPAGVLVPVRDPATNAPYPGNVIPASQRNAFGATFLSYFPLPNGCARSGCNFSNQEPSIPHPRRAQLFRYDLRPTDKDTISIKQQTWFTKSVGWGVAAGPSQWGLTRIRYDFTHDIGKVEYTRILTPHLINEVSVGIFYDEELGPAEGPLAYAAIQKQYDRFAALGTCAPPKACPANGTLVSPGPLAGLKQIAPANNPLGLIPRVTFGSLQNNSQSVPNISFDTRLPLTGEDSAMPITDNLTYTRGAHVFKFGALREAERTQQARASNFSGMFDFSNDANDPLNTGFSYANAFIGHVTAYTESMGRPPAPDRKQVLWAWFAQDTWKVRRNLTLDIGLRMYKWSPLITQGGEASVFSFERFDPKWGGKPPLLYQPTLQGGARRALNPLTNEILPASFIGLMVPGTGYTCGPITKANPCKFNGVVIQDDATYTDLGRGFYNSMPLQYDPRLGIAWDPMGNGKMVVRAGLGAYHDSGAAGTFSGGPAYDFPQTIRYTDLNSYFLGTGPTSPAGVSGPDRTYYKLPVTYQYNIGIQKDIGFQTVLDVAYVGSNSHHTSRNWNYNLLPQGIRFLPSSRDVTKPVSATNLASPGAYDDVFLRPIQGFGDINISAPGTTSRYDSLQVSANRRFLRGFTFSGAYTFAGGTSNGVFQQLPSNLRRSRNTSVQHHVAVFSYVVELPKGSRLLPGAVTRQVLDGWQFQGISTFATGPVSDVSFGTSDGFDFTGGGESCGIVQTGNAALPRDQRNINTWFNTSVFKRPSGRGDIGNNCNNAKFTLPGFNSHDLSLFKKFNLKSEKRTLEFRWETFNAFNHTQFNGVGTTANFAADGTQTNTSFGTVTSVRDARKMMMGLKFSF